jgi:hypothetical protein
MRRRRISETTSEDWQWMEDRAFCLWKYYARSIAPREYVYPESVVLSAVKSIGIRCHSHMSSVIIQT